jgi:hypothetical protein
MYRVGLELHITSREFRVESPDSFQPPGFCGEEMNGNGLDRTMEVHPVSRAERLVLGCIEESGPFKKICSHKNGIVRFIPGLRPKFLASPCHSQPQLHSEITSVRDSPRIIMMLSFHMPFSLLIKLRLERCQRLSTFLRTSK